MPINAHFFGLPITIPNYAYSIFPIIFAAWLARPIGNWLKDHLPVSIRSIFQPLITIFIVGSVVLVIMGPAITMISSGISVAINALLNFNYALSGLVIGGLYQVLVIFGLHWMVVPLIANEIAQTGQSQLNALVNFTMIAQGAGALAVFAIVQIIQDTFLVPKIMGKITGLNPAIILLSLSIWGSLMGMLGMIIALPLTTLMLSYYQRFIINKEKIKYDEAETTDNQETSHN